MDKLLSTEEVAAIEARWKTGTDQKDSRRANKTTFRPGYKVNPLIALGLDSGEFAPKVEVRYFCPTYYTSDVHLTDSCKSCIALRSLRDKRTLDCSFCGKPTSYITATFGTSDLEIAKYDEVLSVDPVIVSEKTVVRAAKVTACPDCADKIKPITHNVRQPDGSYKSEIKMMNCKTFSKG